MDPRNSGSWMRWFIRGVLMFALCTVAAVGLIQLTPVQRFLLSSRAVNAAYRRLSQDPSPYATLKESILQNFPGFGYAYITEEVIGDESDSEEIILELATFVHENIFVPPGYVVLDDGPITVLQRGVGWCDQMAHLFLRLADRRNIPSRLILLKPSKGPSPHSVAEVYLDGAWRVIDPLYLLIARTRQGEIATRQDMCGGELDFGALPPELLELPNYRELFCQDPKIMMGNFASQPGTLEALERGKLAPGPTMARSWQRLFKLPKALGSDLYIHFYVQAIRDRYESEDDYLYAAARTYQVLRKYREARRGYVRLLEDFPESGHRNASMFFLGLTAYHAGQYEESIRVLDDLVEKIPASPWVNYSRLFAAKSALAIGEPERAAAYLEQVNHREPGRDASRLLRRIAQETSAAPL